jgi:hypothetical protein
MQSSALLHHSNGEQLRLIESRSTLTISEQICEKELAVEPYRIITAIELNV